MQYAFGDALLDTSRFELRREGEPVHVEPQVFDVLAHLIEHRDRVVPKEELLDSVWGDQFVSESALTTRIKQLRQAVGDDGRAQRVVQTVHGRGYRFVAETLEVTEATRAGREAELQIEMVRLGWGREDAAFRRFFTSTFIPDAPPELWESFAHLLRRTTSAESAARLMTAWNEIDVLAEAGRVQAPTLVLHCRDDVRVPMEQGRELATLIPGARFVPLDSRNHLLRADEPAWHQFLSEVEVFLAEAPPT